MNKNKTVNVNVGGGFLGLLTIIFITLKLIGEHFHTPVADWSWWIVFSPLWSSFVIVVCVLVVVVFLTEGFNKRR